MIKVHVLGIIINAERYHRVLKVVRVHCFLHFQSLRVFCFTIQKITVSVQVVKLLLESINRHSVIGRQILLEIHICKIVEVIVLHLIVLIRDYRICLILLLINILPLIGHTFERILQRWHISSTTWRRVERLGVGLLISLK